MYKRILSTVLAAMMALSFPLAALASQSSPRSVLLETQEAPTIMPRTSRQMTLGPGQMAFVAPASVVPGNTLVIHASNTQPGVTLSYVLVWSDGSRQNGHPVTGFTIFSQRLIVWTLNNQRETVRVYLVNHSSSTVTVPVSVTVR